MFERKPLEFHSVDFDNRVCAAFGDTVIFQRDIFGSIYFSIQKNRSARCGLAEEDLEHKFGNLTINADGSFSASIKHSLDNVPLDVLRQLSVNFKSCHCPITKNIAYDSNFKIWNFSEREDFETFKAFEDFELEFLDRPGILKQESFYDPNGCDLLTYRELRNFKCYQRVLPPPTLCVNKCYIAEGEFWVFYGGMISAKYVSEEAINYLEKTTKFCNMTRDQISWTLNFCLYLSDAVWKYYPALDKWELLLPDTQFKDSIDVEAISRPHGDIICPAHHRDRKKIYYICRDFKDGSFDSLFEFDYEINNFKRIALNCTFSKQERLNGWDIDLSNDTLILSIGNVSFKNRLLVFCFQTHQIICASFEAIGNSKIVLMDNFQKLVSFPTMVEQYGAKIHYHDWGNVKKKELNPHLEKLRRKFKKSKKGKNHDSLDKLASTANNGYAPSSDEMSAVYRKYNS